MNIELKDWMNSINNTKKNIIDEDSTLKSKYPPYIINKCLSAYVDCLMYSNEMNINNHLDKKMQYDFFINTIRKRQRFSPWVNKEKIDELDLIKKYYGYSTKKAEQALKLLTKKQINFIKKLFDKGGPK